jgi:hypothetical protein
MSPQGPPMPQHFNSSLSDAELATALAKLWPHREHESSALKSFFCRAGLHRWRQLDLEQLVPKRKVDYCFWCSKIRIDGVIFDP